MICHFLGQDKSYTSLSDARAERQTFKCAIIEKAQPLTKKDIFYQLSAFV